jgi:hypothetical protein
MFRLPKYLDEELVRTLADYLGLEIAESRDVRRRASTERGGRLSNATDAGRSTRRHR